MTGPESYVPAGPLDQEPPGGFCPMAARISAMQHVLRGVQLGTHDERVIAWLLGLDDSTIRTIASLLERARAAGSDDRQRLADQIPPPNFYPSDGPRYGESR